MQIVVRIFFFKLSLIITFCTNCSAKSLCCKMLHWFFCKLIAITQTHIKIFFANVVRAASCPNWPLHQKRSLYSQVVLTDLWDVKILWVVSLSFYIFNPPLHIIPVSFVKVVSIATAKHFFQRATKKSWVLSRPSLEVISRLLPRCLAVPQCYLGHLPGAKVHSSWTQHVLHPGARVRPGQGEGGAQWDGGAGQGGQGGGGRRDRVFRREEVSCCQSGAHRVQRLFQVTDKVGM